MEEKLSEGLHLMGDNIRAKVKFCGESVRLYPSCKMTHPETAELDNCRIVDFKVSEATEEEISRFVRSNYPLFDPAFERMSEASHYIEKLYSKSSRFEIWEDKCLIGLCCAYFNREGRFVYIPYLCISSSHSGRGLATEMLLRLMAVGKGNGYEYMELEVRTHNLPAFSLYSKLGFEETGRNAEHIRMRKIL